MDIVTNPLFFTNTIANYSEDNIIDSDCGDIQFINMGIASITINGSIILFANQSQTFGSNVGEMNKSQFRVVFDKTVPVGAGVNTRNLVVVRKIFDWMKKYQK